MTDLASVLNGLKMYEAVGKSYFSSLDLKMAWIMFGLYV